MGWLHQLFSGRFQAGQPDPFSDFWYQPAGITTIAGLHLDAEGAQKVSAYYRGVDILSTSLAMLPLPIWRRLAKDAGREVAREHPLYDLLHRKPNPWQDAFQWKRQQMRHLIHHGNGYSRIIDGARGFVDELRPIHPTLVTPEQLETGRVVFHIRNPKTALTMTFTQDEIFHLRGACDEGVKGKGILEYARDSIGLGVVMESYASRLFSRGTAASGVIEVPGILNEEASRRIAKTFVTAYGEWHLPKVLEQGAKFTRTEMDPEKAQMLLSRKFSVTDIARWLGLPPHMLGDLDRATFTNIEHQGQEFVTYSLGPWLSLWEFAVNDRLILRPETYYAEFTRDALVRGDIATRWEAYVKGVNAGIVAPNEVREKENLRKVDGLDQPRTPANITGNPPASEGPTTRPRSRRIPSDEDEEEPDEEDEGARTRARAIVRESAARVLRKEIRAALHAGVKYSAAGKEWAAWVNDFYADYHEFVMQTMLMDEAMARAYVAFHRTELQAGFAVTKEWTPDYLANLALDWPRAVQTPVLPIRE